MSRRVAVVRRVVWVLSIPFRVLAIVVHAVAFLPVLLLGGLLLVIASAAGDTAVVDTDFYSTLAAAPAIAAHRCRARSATSASPPIGIANGIA